MKKVFSIAIISILIICIASVAYMNFAGAQNIDVKVNKLERIERMSTVNKELSTDIYYLLFTDKGTFRISIDGLFASPQIIGELKPDSVYTLKVVGYEAPILGIYKNVLSIENRK